VFTTCVVLAFKTFERRKDSFISVSTLGLDKDSESAALREFELEFSLRLLLFERLVVKYFSKLEESNVEVASELPKDDRERKLCCFLTPKEAESVNADSSSYKDVRRLYLFDNEFGV
jgi:hypothetical protein